MDSPNPPRTQERERAKTLGILKIGLPRKQGVREEILRESYNPPPGIHFRHFARPL